MKAAAVALTLGITDPLSMLALGGHDLAVLQAIVSEANVMQDERDRAQADYLAQRTANAILPGLVKSLNKTLQQIAKSMRG